MYTFEECKFIPNIPIDSNRLTFLHSLFPVNAIQNSKALFWEAKKYFLLFFSNPLVKSEFQMCFVCIEKAYTQVSVTSTAVLELNTFIFRRNWECLYMFERDGKNSRYWDSLFVREKSHTFKVLLTRSSFSSSIPTFQHNQAPWYRINCFSLWARERNRVTIWIWIFRWKLMRVWMGFLCWGWIFGYWEACKFAWGGKLFSEALKLRI